MAPPVNSPLVINKLLETFLLYLRSRTSSHFGMNIGIKCGYRYFPYSKPKCMAFPVNDEVLQPVPGLVSQWVLGTTWFIEPCRSGKSLRSWS